MAKAHWVLVAVFVYSSQIALVSAAETLSVNTASAAPLATPQQEGYHDLIAIELFKRIGVNITIHMLPGERSLINLNQGIVDATFVHIKGIEKAYPNVRMVPENIMEWMFVAFTIDPKIKVKEWADLKPYSVAYINGRKIFERNVLDVKFVTKTSKPSQLFDLLVSGRADVILFEKWSGLEMINQRGMTQVQELTPPLATRKMFMYVHNKHNALVDKLATAIRTMKADGSYDLIYERTLAPLLTKRLK